MTDDGVSTSETTEAALGMNMHISSSTKRAFADTHDPAPSEESHHPPGSGVMETWKGTLPPSASFSFGLVGKVPA